MAAKASVELLDVDSTTVGQRVPIAVITPPGFDAGNDPLPLCLTLHGGGGDRSAMAENVALYDRMFAEGSLTPLVLVSASTGPMSWYAGSWEDFIAEELPAAMAKRYHTRTDSRGTAITGISMGGYGSLKIALRRPGRFAAIAAMEPGIEPGFQRSTATPRNTFYRFPEVDAVMWGSPVDEARWQADNPASLARANADAIRASGIEIYLEAGDEDELNLHDGTEFLHRALWDLDIRHEYHAVRWAGHVGPTFAARIAEAHRFLSNALSGGLSAPSDPEFTPQELRWIEWVDGGMAGEPVVIDMTSERAGALLTRMMADKRAPAAAADPTMARAYAPMPRSDK